MTTAPKGPHPLMGLLLGLLSLLCPFLAIPSCYCSYDIAFWISFFPLLGLIGGVAGLILSLCSRRRGRMALVGLLFSLFGLSLCLFTFFSCTLCTTAVSCSYPFADSAPEQIYGELFGVGAFPSRFSFFMNKYVVF